VTVMRQPLACLLCVLLLGGCAATRSTAPSIEPTAPLVLIAIESSEDAEAIVHRANQTGATGVLIEVGDNATSLLEAMGATGLQRMARVTAEASGDAADGRTPSQRLRHWLQTNDVDRLHIEMSSSQARRVEAIAVEARLVRDYLIVTSNVNEPLLGGVTQLSIGDGDASAGAT
jgi:hypothetical protein